MVTWQYNGFGDNQRYETIIVRFDVEAADEIVFDNAFSAYPNPTSGILYLSDELSNVQLFDIAGRQVYSASDILSVIDLSEIAAGTYILVAEKDGERISTKIIKN